MKSTFESHGVLLVIAQGDSEGNAFTTGTTRDATSGGQNTSLVQPASGSIENLFGRVTFTYRINGSSNEAQISVVFTAADEGDLILGGRSVTAFTDDLSVMACAEFPLPDLDFICASVSNAGGDNQVFVFTMDSQFQALVTMSSAMPASGRFLWK